MTNKPGTDPYRHGNEMEWLCEVGRQINAARTRSEMLDVVYRGIREGLGYDRVVIQVFDHDNELVDWPRDSDREGTTDGALCVAEDSTTWRSRAIAALRAGAAFYYTGGTDAATPSGSSVPVEAASRPTMVVALRYCGRLTGTISVGNRPLCPPDARPLVALAHHVGTALENTRLYEQEQGERARLEVLLESSRAFNSTLDRNQILNVLAARLVSVLGAAAVSFGQIDPAGDKFQPLAQCAAPGRSILYPHDRPYIASIDTYPAIKEMLRSRRPFCGRIDDAGFPDTEKAFLEEHNLKAELLTPVIVRDEAVGILEVYWDHVLEITADTVALCTAITEQAGMALENAHLYAEAAARADLDALTGLLNHRALLEQIDAAVASGERCALLLLDVDNFKLFNDTYGHPVGDGVLMQVAATLQAVCRDGDAAGRYGGDEFAVLLRGASISVAESVMRRLSDAVRAQPHIAHDGIVIPLSVSVGMACYPAEGKTRPELVAVADAAMYAAKRGNLSRTIHATMLLVE